MNEFDTVDDTIQKTIRKFPKEQQHELSIAFNVLKALIRGPLKNYGFICDVDGKSLRITTTELAVAIKFLQSHGYSISRTDCGGAPTWELNS